MSSLQRSSKVKEFDFKEFSNMLNNKNIQARVEADKYAEINEEETEKFRAKGYWQGWEDATRNALYIARLIIEGEQEVIRKNDELQKLRESLINRKSRSIQ